MKLVRVNSSNLHSVAYDPLTRLLVIEFHSGARYQYRGVPPTIYSGLMSAASHGRFHARHIKKKYPYTKL